LKTVAPLKAKKFRNLGLGIHHDRDAPAARRGDRRGDQYLGERPLVVVLEHQRIRLDQRRQRRRDEALLVLSLDRRLDLLVDPHHLLPSREHPGLRRGRPARDRHQVPVFEPRRHQLGPDPLRVTVVTHRADQPAGGPDRGDVRRHIRRPAQRAPGLPHRDHRHRSLGRQPMGVAPQVPVQHHIAHHRDATAFHPVEQVDEPLAGDRRRRWGGSHGRER
jgi:hypothetical protein